MKKQRRFKNILVMAAGSFTVAAFLAFSALSAERPTNKALGKSTEVTSPALTEAKPYLLVRLKRLSTRSGDFKRVTVDTSINALDKVSLNKEMLSYALSDQNARQILPLQDKKLSEDASIALTKDELGPKDEMNLDMTVSYKGGFFESPTVYGVKDLISLRDLELGKPTHRVYRISSADEPGATTTLEMEIIRKY